MLSICKIRYNRCQTRTRDDVARPRISASPGTRRATKQWRRTVTLGGPGPRAVPTRHRAVAPLRPLAPVAVH